MAVQLYLHSRFCRGTSTPRLFSYWGFLMLRILFALILCFAFFGTSAEAKLVPVIKTKQAVCTNGSCGQAVVVKAKNIVRKAVATPVCVVQRTRYCVRRTLFKRRCCR